MSLFCKKTVQILFLCLLSVSCNINKNSLKISAANFTDEIETQQNLVFTFNRDLVSDSIINKWDSVAYIKFTPVVKGMFKWNSTRELVFSPATGFQPSTDYNGVFTEEFTGKCLEKLNRDDLNPIIFHTTYLKLLSTDAFWAKSMTSGNEIALHLNLHFNCRVDPNEIKNLAKFFVNGKPTTFEIKNSATGNNVTLYVVGIQPNSGDPSIVEIKIDKGLRCVDSPYKTTGEQSLSQTLPSAERLNITQVQGNFEGVDACLEVNANQPVDQESIQNTVSVIPAVAFTVENRESGFVLKGNFQAGASYELKISKKLKGLFGGEMVSDFISLVPFGQLQPSLGFKSSKGLYLSSKGSKTIGISIVNIPKIKLTVTRIYENNIQTYIRNNRYTEWDGDEQGHSYDYGDYNLDQLGDVVMKQDYETKDLGKVNGVNLLNLDFSEQGQFKGIYLVKVQSAEDQWQKAVKLISVSDIGLIAKETADEIYVFANSILTAEPMAGIKISLTSSNNQVLFSGTTNKDGLFVFSGIKKQFPGFRLAMITARSGNDFNFLMFNDSRVENSRFDVGGRRRNESGYLAYIYGDREIYRPGETIHNNTIIRNEGRETVSDLPVKIKYLLPNGNEMTVIRKNLNKQGACESSIEIPVNSVTGTYTMEMYTSNDLLVSSKNISVEEFIPDRINVVLNTSRNTYELTDSIVADFEALNLFGPPAANRDYEAEFSFNRKYFYSKAFPSYNFNIQDAEKLSFASRLKQGKTDTQGKGHEQFSLDQSYAYEGVLAGRILVTVFDESGRPVNRIKNIDIRTQKTFFGIKINDYYVGTGNPIQISCASVNAEGNVVEATTARMQVVRVKWHTVMERTYDTHYRYVSQREEELLVDKTIRIEKGGSAIPFVPNESGEYLVRLLHPGSSKYIESQFYAYRWGNTTNSSFEVNNEGQVEIIADQQKYKPGDMAKLLFKTPFAGRLLVTIERDKVFEYYYLKTDKKSAMLSIPLKNEYLPNVYVSATLFKPLDDGSLPLTVAHGYSSLQVENASYKLPVEILAVEKSKSKTKQSITIKTLAKSDIEITVAVVDEGIMQLKNSLSPDPYTYFYQKQALDVNSFDVYPYLLPDLKMKRSGTGGDGYDLQKRVNPLSNKRVKLVAWWSGHLKTNATGEAKCSFEIPQFSGDLRVMAVAYKDKSFGSAEKHIKVADPVVISTSLPRFLSPGDTLVMPVTITNTLGKPASVNCSLSVTGPISVVGRNAETVSVLPNGETRLNWKIAAQKNTGEGSVETVVNSNGTGYSDKTELTIRPAASLQKLHDAGSMVAGTTRILDLTTDFIPKSTEAKLLISRSPVVQFTDELEYLLDYPYGCVEQTTSIAFPQLYYSDLIKAIKTKPGHPVSISRNVQAAISKLQSMQLYNGALSYWQGESEESWWGSSYACHFLLEAKRAGYEVNKATVDKIVLYLGQKAKGKADMKYTSLGSDGKIQTKLLADKTIFYSLYVLALAGKPDLATMNYYKYKTLNLALDSRYLLASTFLICGDRKGFSDILPVAFSGEEALNEADGSFSSYVRDEALALTGLLETDADNPQVAVMVNHLSKQIRVKKYLSTQERAFAFLAIGKFMKRNNQNNTTAVLTADGALLAEFKGDDLVLRKGLANKKISVQAKGNGNLYYCWQMEGLSEKGSFKEEDSYLRIRKSFYSRFGQLVSGTTFKQNDLVVVKLSLQNTERSDIRNIVITDMLPAGFEIENPRIGAVPELSWIKDNAQTDHMDVRDDRINLFTSVNNTTKNFYYLVRAVSTGKFIMGPVSADAMYNGEYHSYNGGGSVNIEAK